MAARDRAVFAAHIDTHLQRCSAFALKVVDVDVYGVRVRAAMQAEKLPSNRICTPERWYQSVLDAPRR